MTKHQTSKPRQRQRAYALVTVFMLVAIASAVLAGVMDWTLSTSRLNDRNNQYNTTLVASEAATEKVLSRMVRDYKNLGEASVYSSLDTYRTLVPNTTESPWWGQFEFNNASGTIGQTYVQRLSTTTFVPLESQYTGLSGFAASYRIISNARSLAPSLLDSTYSVLSAVQQDVQLASIPVFQYAIFYNTDMELNGCSTLYVRGRVHGNLNLHTGSSANQTFYSDVTLAGSIIHSSRYGYSTSGTVSYLGQKDTNVTTLSLPIGTNNTSAAVHAVIERPPAGEAVDSAMGRQRYYNKAELLILVTNSTVSVGLKNPFEATTNSIPWNQVTNFVSTNVVFTDQREGKSILTTEINVGKLITWAATNATVASKLGAGNPPNLLYIADERTTTGSQLTGVRLVNAQTLPSRGLTVATPNPIYTKGHFNQPTTSHLGTTNTSNTKPSSLIADAYTLLSANFNDSQSSSSYTVRIPSDTTVNAAIIAGNVLSTPSYYSGGVNNLARLLEKWSGYRYTLNGSIVCLFQSVKASAPFQLPGVYYSAPTRDINFDLNFLDQSKLPPGTPELRVLVRGRWLLPPPGVTNYAGL